MTILQLKTSAEIKQAISNNDDVTNILQLASSAIDLVGENARIFDRPFDNISFDMFDKVVFTKLLYAWGETQQSSDSDLIHSWSLLNTTEAMTDLYESSLLGTEIIDPETLMNAFTSDMVTLLTAMISEAQENALEREDALAREAQELS